MVTAQLSLRPYFFFFVVFFAVTCACVAAFLVRSLRAFFVTCEGSERLPLCELLVGERSLRPLALVMLPRCPPLFCPPLLPIDAIVVDSLGRSRSGDVEA